METYLSPRWKRLGFYTASVLFRAAIGLMDYILGYKQGVGPVFGGTVGFYIVRRNSLLRIPKFMIIPFLLTI